MARTAAANVRFCNGPSCQVTRFVLPLVTCICPVVSLGCHIIRSEEVAGPSFQRRLQSSGIGHCGFTIFTVPAVGLRVGVAAGPIS